MKTLRFLLLASAALNSVCFSAQADDGIVPPVVVSATRTPTPIDDIASSVTVITAEDIAQQNKQTVADILREVPGVAVTASGGPAQTARAYIRGTNSNHVLVLVDGVRVIDPSDVTDAFDFSNLTTDNIERIEILRGPQSTLYGSEAIGGVISITTKLGKGAPASTAFAEYGRYNSRKIGVGNAGEIGRTSYSFSASENHSGGFSSFDKRYGGKEKDGTDGYTVSGNAESKLTDALTAKLNMRYNRQDTEFDAFGADSYGLTNDSRQFNGRAAGELALLDGKWKQELGVSTLNTNRFIASDYGYSHYLGNRQTVDWVHHVQLMPGNVAVIGTEAYRESYKGDSFKSYRTDNKAVFISDQYDITKSLFVSGGVRYDDNRYFGGQATWKIAPGYRILETGTTLKATYGTGFKAPSLFQLYSLYGNPVLNPERSKGWDAGFEQDVWGKKASFGSTWFRNDLRGLIDFNFATNHYYNVGRARTQGLESFVTVYPTSALTVKLTHTFLRAEDLDTNQRLLRRPQQQGTASVLYQYNEKGDIGLTGRYQGLRKDVGFDYATIDNKAYAAFDLSTNYYVLPNTAVYARLENMFNKHYEEIYGYATSGMALYGGIKTRF